MFIYFITLTVAICAESARAGVPALQSYQHTTYSEAPTVVLRKVDLLLEAVSNVEVSVKSIQEKAHMWAILHHHIEAWNDGIRILENKLDLLKRTHEEQQSHLNVLEHAIVRFEEDEKSLKNDIKNLLKKDYECETKIIPSIDRDEMESERLKGSQNPSRNALYAPIIPDNLANKIEEQLGEILVQMTRQKDLKPLQSLHKRNANVLEMINRSISEVLETSQDIKARLQGSDECCQHISGELTTFTESSDFLLKRIEKLMQDMSFKLDQIEKKYLDPATTCSTENDDESDEGTVDATDGDSDGFTSEPEMAKEFLRPKLRGCHELLSDDANGGERIDGVYKFHVPEINQHERDFNERFCMFPTKNDSSRLPWTLIQRRGPYHQQENFNRSWAEYRNGFGNLQRDFWFGNEHIHQLVYSEDYELRIELEDFNQTQVWAEYSTFRLDSERYNYNLLIDGYSGTAEDAMKYHNDNSFTTYDRRNDRSMDECCSCAIGYASGWWFDNCAEANLNGIYQNTPLGHNYVGIMWDLWHGDYSLKATRMMIRPKHPYKKKENTVNETEDP